MWNKIVTCSGHHNLPKMNRTGACGAFKQAGLNETMYLMSDAAMNWRHCFIWTFKSTVYENVYFIYSIAS